VYGIDGQLRPTSDSQANIISLLPLRVVTQSAVIGTVAE